MSDQPIPLAQDFRAFEASLLATLLDIPGTVIVGLRPDGRVYLWNRAAEELYRVPHADAIGLPYIERFVPSAQRAVVAADFQKVLAGRPTREFENETLLLDGSVRTLSWNVSRVLGPDGSPLGILALGRDVTERREAEDRFRVLFEHVQDGLVMADDSGVIDCNPAALRLLGLERREQLIGHRPAEFSPPAQPDGQASDEKSRALGRETALRGALNFEWMHQRPDGTTVPVEVAVRHATLLGRRISVVSWHDLTRRKALEREQQELQARLLSAQKLEAVGELAGGVAHDFNNLLTAIRNSIELARERGSSSTESAEDLSLALETLDRAAALTRQLLAYSRRESVRPGPVDLAAAVRDTLRLLRTSIPTGIAVTAELDKPAVVIADRSQLEQVALNLLLNARDAMPKGGHLHVSVTSDLREGVATLVVRDDGVGMDEATQQRIFEPFFTTRGVGDGAGLGLAVVYGVVTQSGGQVHVQSELGKGSQFEVRLPLVPDEAPGIAEDSSGPSGENSKTLLLVEDEASVRLTTRRLLERLGWEVVIASDGQEGWETFQARRSEISMVVTDVRMPRRDGISLVRLIRELAPNCPVLVVSGYDRVSGDTAAGLERTAFLSKPFTTAALSAALKQARTAVRSQ